MTFCLRNYFPVILMSKHIRQARISANLFNFHLGRAVLDDISFVHISIGLNIDPNVDSLTSFPDVFFSFRLYIKMKGCPERHEYLRFVKTLQVLTEEYLPLFGSSSGQNLLNKTLPFIGLNSLPEVLIRLINSFLQTSHFSPNKLILIHYIRDRKCVDLLLSKNVGVGKNARLDCMRISETIVAISIIFAQMGYCQAYGQCSM